MLDFRNVIRVAACVAIVSAIGVSCATGVTPTETTIYLMTYTDVSQTTRGFHTRALLSPDLDLAGEGCVRKVSEEEALNFANALKIGPPNRDSKATIEDAGVMTVSNSLGQFAGPLSIYSARDFEGNIYKTTQAEYLEIYRMGLQILLNNGCEDARFRLEIEPYK